MKEDLHHIDKLFKSSIEEHEEMPPRDVWAAIDKNLDKNKVIDITQRYLTLRKVAIILVVLLASISFYEVFTWKNADRTAENRKVNKNNHISNQDKSVNDTVDENPVLLKNTTDTSRLLSSGRAYSETNNSVQKVGNVKEKLSRNNLQKSASVHNQTVQRNTPPGFPYSGLSSATNTFVDSTTEADNLKQGFKASNINKGLQPVEGTKAKPRTASDGDDLSAVSTGTVQTIPRGSIDTYTNFSLLPFDSHSFASINGVSVYPVKLSKKSSPFAVTVFYSRDFVSNRLSTDKFGGHERDRDEIRRTESGSSAFTAGVIAEYGITKNWSLHAGLNMSTTTIHIEPKTIYAKPDNFGNVKFKFDCSAGYSFLPVKTGMPPASGDSLRVSESSNTTQYFGVPLALKYNTGAGKFRFSVMSGISANVLVNQKIRTVIASSNEKSIVNEINGLRPFYFSGSVGVNFDYYVSKHVAISLIPSGRFALTSINKDAPVRSYPRSFGLGAGIRLQL